jgi:hypothetical protein
MLQHAKMTLGFVYELAFAEFWSRPIWACLSITITRWSPMKLNEVRYPFVLVPSFARWFSILHRHHCSPLRELGIRTWVTLVLSPPSLLWYWDRYYVILHRG